MVCFLVLMVLSSCRFCLAHSSPDEGVEYGLPYPFSTVVEFDSTSLTFQGCVRITDSDYFSSANSVTGKIDRLSKLPQYEGWLRGVSVIDIEDNRFFFVVLNENSYRLVTVDKTQYRRISLDYSGSSE